MSYFSCEFPKELFKTLNKMENSEEICKKMLTEAIPIIEAKLKDAIRGSHTQTGDLVDSIKSFEPWQSKNGAWIINSAPTGRTKKIKRAGKVYKRSKHGTKSSGTAFYNADKLWFLEAGTSKQPATPIITKVIKDTEAAATAKMQEVFEREVGK